MKVFKDVVGSSRDELFSDAFPIERLPALYAVSAQTVDPFDGLIAEGLGDADESESEEGEESDRDGRINLVEAHGLQLASFDKAGYAAHLEGYLKRVETYLSENNPARVAEFKKEAREVADAVAADFDSYTFYQGVNQDDEGLVAFARPTGDNTWIFNFWADGTRDEKY